MTEKTRRMCRFNEDKMDGLSSTGKGPPMRVQSRRVWLTAKHGLRFGV